MFIRTVFMSLLASGVNGQLRCNGAAPLRNIFGAEVSCSRDMMMPPPVPLPTDSVTYMAMAGAGDLYEIQSGQIALLKGSVDARNFGQMLITDHTKTTATLQAQAASVGLLPPPPILNPMQQQMINELQLASPASFDSIFWQQQVKAHKMALDLQSNYAARGDVAALRAAAASAVPIVQMHLNTAATKVSMMGGSCPANYWCHGDGMSFAVCCPSDAYVPSVSIVSPYFSASVSTPILSSTPVWSAPLYRPLYTPAYASVGF